MRKTTTKGGTPPPFDDVPGLTPALAAAVRSAFGYDRTTAPQAAYLPVAMDASRDLLVKASTGSGKTLGFLLPTLQRLAAADPAAGRPIRALVMSPSRELAEQTREQAAKLSAKLSAALTTKIGVQMLIGGMPIEKDRRRLSNDACDLLVATPGRLLDHLETTPGFAARFSELQTLVLDEADRLLDQGFERAINKIAAFLGPPRPARQLLLFTATVPDGVLQVAKRLARPAQPIAYVDTSGLTAGLAAKPDIVHATRVVPAAALIPELCSAIERARSADERQHKVIVFVPTAKLAEFFAEFFSVQSPSPEGGGRRRQRAHHHRHQQQQHPQHPQQHPQQQQQQQQQHSQQQSRHFASTQTRVLELHSRLSQPQRDRNALAFREGSAVLMFASDVAARGLDFPGVTHVIQFGIASDAEQVVHRAGRTGRGGKRGEALTLLCDDESAVLPELSKLNIATNLPPVVLGPEDVAEIPAAIRHAIRHAIARVETPGDPLRAQACASLVAGLGFYKSNLRRLKWNAQALVANLVRRFEAIGLVGPPRCPVSPKLGLGVKEV